jgi:hypothetical protein
MIEVFTTDPSLVMTAAAAAGLAVLLRRLHPARRAARSATLTRHALSQYSAQVRARLRTERPPLIDLERRPPIDLRETLDLTEPRPSTQPAAPVADRDPPNPSGERPSDT